MRRNKLNIRFYTLIFVFLSFTGFVIYFHLVKTTESGQILLEKTNENIKIRILAKSVFYMQFYYEIQKGDKNSENWKTVFLQLQDDPIEITDKQIGFAGDEIGYFFFGNVFGVSIDSGENWNYFDFVKQTKFGKNEGYATKINEIKLNSNGNGMLSFEHSQSPIMLTNDFGLNWEEVTP